MSDMIPYQADPYRQGSAGGQDYLSAQGYPFPDGTGLPGGQVGYYSADYLSGWSDPYLASPGSQGIPYPGAAPQMYGQPYSQQHPYPQAPYGPYTPYGQARTGAGPTIRAAMRPMRWAGGRSGSVLPVYFCSAILVRYLESLRSS